MSREQKSRIMCFGSFQADLRAEELYRNGVKVKLQKQPFQLLAILLQRPGDLVTREELRSLMWPSDTFVDFEHSLNVAVRRLRESLGDDAERPIFIETLPRRGYRFIATVNTALSMKPAPLSKFSYRRLLGLAMPSVLLAIAAVRWNPLLRSGLGPDSAGVKIVPAQTSASESKNSSLPPGTYLASCRDAVVQGKVLAAVCQKLNASWQATTLPDWTLCVGDIWNVDGFIGCEAHNKQPDPDLDPTGFYTHLGQAERFEQQGLYDAAISEYYKVISAATPIQGTCGPFWLAHAYGAAGNRAAANKIIHDTMAKVALGSSSYCIAQAYAPIDRPQALSWLERASQANDPRTRFMSSDWRLSALYADSKFQHLASTPRK